jgi:hypothetical protein
MNFVPGPDVGRGRAALLASAIMPPGRPANKRKKNGVKIIQLEDFYVTEKIVLKNLDCTIMMIKYLKKEKKLCPKIIIALKLIKRLDNSAHFPNKQIGYGIQKTFFIFSLLSLKLINAKK